MDNFTKTSALCVALLMMTPQSLFGGGRSVVNGIIITDQDRLYTAGASQEENYTIFNGPQQDLAGAALAARVPITVVGQGGLIGGQIRLSSNFALIQRGVNGAATNTLKILGPIVAANPQDQLAMIAGIGVDIHIDPAIAGASPSSTTTTAMQAYLAAVGTQTIKRTRGYSGDGVTPLSYEVEVPVSIEMNPEFMDVNQVDNRGRIEFTGALFSESPMAFNRPILQNGNQIGIRGFRSTVKHMVAENLAPGVSAGTAQGVTATLVRRSITSYDDQSLLKRLGLKN